MEGELITVMIDKVMIHPYVGKSYHTWDVHNGRVLIEPLYKKYRLG